LKTTSLLLDHGANPNALAKNYVTPLHLAASSGHHEVVKVLLTKGADASRMDING
jgi:ankyrin repeat family A protein 2